MEISRKDWDWCPMCGPHIKCPKCGNNCCNASYGYLPSRTPWGEPGDVRCDVCPSAYDYQESHYNEGKRKFWFRWMISRCKVWIRRKSNVLSRYWRE